MNRQQLCELTGATAAAGPDFVIGSVTEDSRKAGRGALFVAVGGGATDGHEFAASAVAAGAVAVLGDREGISEWCGAPYLYSPEPRRALGLIAHALAGNPSQSMTVIGVTGTNGKSSTVYLIQSILEQGGFRAAKFGTLGYEIAGETLPAPHTTPFGEVLADAFSRARAKGMSHVVMEASSHSLDQERVAGIDFGVAAFTNLTRDHLDYHKDMDDYRRAKLKLFDRISGAGKFTVVNREDPAADYFIAASRVPCFTYGKKGDCRASRIVAELRRTVFQLSTPWGEGTVETTLLGEHNVANALCAIAVCGGLGVPVPTLIEGIAALKRVPGRFEPVDAGQEFQVIVDYAHTDDALRNVLDAARAICKKRVLVVFGCGGDRDRGKRPKMGKVAAEMADFAILTSDNPRTEDPVRILLDVEAGIQSAAKRRNDDYLVIEQREEAIARAIAMARPGDLVMIAGKGHEDYQIIGKERRHFDDREVSRSLLEHR